MTDSARKRTSMRVLAGALLAAAVLAVLVPPRVADPERTLQGAVADALAADSGDRLLAVALEQYPQSAAPIR